MFYWSFTSLVRFWPPPIFNAGYAYVISRKYLAILSTPYIFIMRPSSLGGGRILRRTLSVRLSFCLSVRPVIVAIGNVFSSTASVTDVLFATH